MAVKVRDDDCNSCDVQSNITRISSFLPFIPSEDVSNFLIELCDELTPQDKHNIWSILKSRDSRYSTQTDTPSRDLLAPHKLHITTQWFKSDAVTYAQRLTFVLKTLCYVRSKALELLKEYLTAYSDYVNEEDFKPNMAHCPWSGQWVHFSETTGSVDFISKLPVTVSKLILSYVGLNRIWGARLVSKRWYTIVKQLVTEHKQFRAHVFRCRALRPARRNINPTFANKAALCFTRGICTTGHPYNSEEAQGSVKVILEERNVYCGAYHVINLLKQTDTQRKLHYCRGKYFVVGSKDRHVQIRTMQSGKLHKTIVGHAGSIHSLLLIESKKIVISGSYDLTIRAWSIETGAYLRLWRGHRGTITCLDHNDTTLVSGAKDSMVKVWYLTRSVIKRTLHHPRPIQAVKLLGDRIAVGTQSFKYFLWEVHSGVPLKVFQTVGSIRCVSLTPHYIMGGAGNVLYIWNMISLDAAPMFTFPHPSSLLAVQYCYVRCITGCEDGKIRVWSLVTGDCIKVIRGNARSDPITALYVDTDRLLINTSSTVISLNFQHTSWDYCSERFHEERLVKEAQSSSAPKRRCKSAVQLRNYVSNNTVVDEDLWAVRRPSGMSDKPVLDIDNIPSTPEVPPSTPRNDEEEEEEIKTTVYKAATRQYMFQDVFNREEVTCKKMIEYTENRSFVGNLNRGPSPFAPSRPSPQLHKVKSKRPCSAPFVSLSLSVHGHLPSFQYRRPRSAALVRHQIEVEPVEKWQSTWQKLLSDIPETEKSELYKKERSSHGLRSSVCRPKTATARITY